MADAKTTWELELVDDVSPAAKRADSALARLQRRFQAMSAGALNRAVQRTNQLRNGLHRLAASGGVLGAVARKGRETFAYLSTAAYASSAMIARSFSGSRIGRAVSAVSSGVGRMSAKFREAAISLKTRFGPALVSARQKALDFAKTGLLVVSAVAAAAVAKIGATAAAFADFGQKSRKALELMTGSVEDGDAAFERFRGTAKSMGLAIRSTVADAQGLLAKGFTVPETDALLKMGADMTAIGASSEKVKSVFDAMGKIKATGYLQGDELNMLVEAGIASSKIYDSLGAKLGKTRQELIKMKEGGKLAASDVLNAVGSAVLTTTGQTEFGAARMKVMGSSLSGMWDKMKVNAEDFWLKLGERSSGAFVKTFGSISGQLNKWLSGDGAEGWLAGMSAGIASVGAWVQRSIPLVKTFMSELIGGFREAWGAIVPALGQFSSGGMDWHTVLGLVGKSLGQVAAATIAVAGVLGGALTAAVVAGSAILQGMIGYFNGIIEVVGRVAFTIDDWLGNLGAKWRTGALEAVKWMIEGFVDGIKAGVGRVGKAVTGLAQSAIEAFRGPEGIDAHSPSRKFWDAGVDSSLGYAGGWSAQSDNARDSFASSGAEFAGASAGVSSGGRSGGNVVNITLTVQAPQGGTREHGEQWGRGAVRGLRGEFAGVLEDLALETGT